MKIDVKLVFALTNERKTLRLLSPKEIWYLTIIFVAIMLLEDKVNFEKTKKKAKLAQENEATHEMRAPSAWNREKMLFVCCHVQGACCSGKIDIFVVFSLRVRRKNPVFKPKPIGKYAYKYKSFYSQFLIQNLTVQEEASVRSIKRSLSPKPLFLVCFISFLICLLLPWVTKHILIRVLRWISIFLLVVFCYHE
jgi:hypothetical protein